MNKKFLKTLAAAATLTMTMEGDIMADAKTVHIATTSTLAKGLKELHDQEDLRFDSHKGTQAVLTPYPTEPTKAWNAAIDILPGRANGAYWKDISQDNEGKTTMLKIAKAQEEGHDEQNTPLTILLGLRDVHASALLKTVVWVKCSSVEPIIFRSMHDGTTLLVDGTVNLHNLKETNCSTTVEH